MTRQPGPVLVSGTAMNKRGTCVIIFSQPDTAATVCFTVYCGISTILGWHIINCIPHI